MGFLKADGENYLLMNRFNLVEKPKKLMLTNDPKLIQTSFDPASQATRFKGKCKQYSLIFYLDFISIPKYLTSQYGAQLKSFSLNVEELESIEFLQGALIDQQASGSIKILFLDRETNSLLQIVNYVKRMSEKAQMGA